MEKVYINEELAQRAHNNNYMSDYKENSTTISWLDTVETAKKELEKENLTPEQIENILESFKNKTSDWINRKNSADASHVSWFISGPANYNMKKHERWQNSIDKLFKEYDYIFNIENYLPKVKRTEIKQDIEEKEFYFNDIKVLYNTEENRLQLYFDGKPSENIRNILKKNAYKWSNKNQCWQRQLTKNAIYNFERIKDSLIEEVV